MDWLVFSYSLPSKASSTPRVTVWRRLRRLGAVVLAGGVYLLPDREECAESFQWLAQEIRQAQGEAAVMHVTRVEGLTDQALIGLFQAARKEEYDELDAQTAAIEQQIGGVLGVVEREGLPEAIERLRRRHAEITRVDYFASQTGVRVGARIAGLTRALMPGHMVETRVDPARIEEYRDAHWVTRPRPHVDRLACAWLIRRYINRDAAIRYSLQPEPHEVAFDMPEARFGHHGNLCTFETMVQAFGLNDPGIRSIAEIVHEIDLRDGLYGRPEVVGIEVVLAGWLVADLSDTERETHGIALFDGLFSALVQANVTGKEVGDQVSDTATNSSASQG